MNGWSYVENNPLGRIDPSGRKPSEDCSGLTCGPDVTEWFMVEIEKHIEYGGSVRKAQKALMLEAFRTRLFHLGPVTWDEVNAPAPFGEIIKQFELKGMSVGDLPVLLPLIPVTVMGLGTLEYGLYGLAVDYSNINYFNLELFRLVLWPNYYPKGVELLGDIGAAFNQDPRGATVGWSLAATRAYKNRKTFCDMLYGFDDAHYRENRVAASWLSPCTTDRVSPDLKRLSPPSSLARVSSGKSTIEWLYKLLPFK